MRKKIKIFVYICENRKNVSGKFIKTNQKENWRKIAE